MSSTEDKLQNVLKKSPYGLTAEEIASRLEINEKTASRLLDKMSSKKKAKKTKAGESYFYRISLFAILFLSLVFSTAHAEDMNSTNYNINPIVDDAGGKIDSNTYIVFGSFGKIYSRSSSISFDLCAGFICSFIEFIANAKVTLLLEFNLSGNANDTALVDNYTAIGQYVPRNLLNYYACLHDVSLPNSPTFGIIFAGSSLNYINLSSGNSFVLRVSQDIPGNKFILPVTSGNCTVFNTRLAQIAQFGTLLQPFVIASETINAIELALSYPAIDIIGGFERTGPFTLVIEKNETNEDQIIVKPE